MLSLPKIYLSTYMEHKFEYTHKKCKKGNHSNVKWHLEVDSSLRLYFKAWKPELRSFLFSYQCFLFFSLTQYVVCKFFKSNKSKYFPLRAISFCLTTPYNLPISLWILKCIHTAKLVISKNFRS